MKPFTNAEIERLMDNPGRLDTIQKQMMTESIIPMVAATLAEAHDKDPETNVMTIGLAFMRGFVSGVALAENRHNGTVLMVNEEANGEIHSK